MKTSLNGAPIQTGRGLEETKRRIMEAFERVRQHPAPLPPLSEEKQPLPPETQVYTEAQREGFHRRANALSLSALNLPLISNPTGNGVYEVFVPSETAEELFRQAGGV